jgi:hypothetical protein
MKKTGKSSKPTKKAAARRPAVKKPAAKSPAAKQPAKTAPPSEPRNVAAARYTPPPLRADGWGPFRYPPQ